MVSRMEDGVRYESGVEKYVAVGSLDLGKCFSGISPMSHSAVATHVALNKACSLSALVITLLQSGSMRVAIKGEGSGPDTYLFSWKRVSTIRVDK